MRRPEEDVEVFSVDCMDTRPRAVLRMRKRRCVQCRWCGHSSSGCLDERKTWRCSV